MSGSDTRYGLPSPRDKDGELLPVEHTYDWQGQEVTIKAVPPTVSELDGYENLGFETSFGDLYEIVDKHLLKPELPSQDDTSGRELSCYLQGIMNIGGGDGVDFAEAARDALDERASDSGN